MSGKAYSMKEMKAIVEYLTEHRAYNEIKGRKMWMDLASSNVTTRTWQSLKETFLKRILPDIHNPYYKLSITQISSFRAGQDIEKKLTNNRLQIRSTSQDTDTNVKEQVTEKPGNSNEIEDKIAGEDHKLSNLRASTETLVLENCYETAEEIRKDLQSPTNEAEEDKEKKPTKTMRELLTYSEPLTPMLQSVIDDFVSDDEEEPKMQIVEPEEATDRNNENIEENDTIEISDSEGNDVREEHKQTKNIDDRPSSPNKNEHAVTSKSQELEITNQKSTTLLNQTNDTANGKVSSDVKNAENNNVKSSSEITQNNSASITDTFLPGNQEALEENMKNLPEKRSSLRLNKKTNVENCRKRASSQDAGPKTKKRILSKLKSISDSEKSAPTNGNIFIKSKLSTVKQTLTEINKTSSHVNKENFENSPTQKKTAENLQDSVMKNTAEMENPCLKNVSLYAEQFSTEKYIDSDTSNMEDDKNDNIDKNKKNENIKDKNAKKTDKKENSENRNENIVNRKDKTGYTKKKKSNENEKRSDKVGDTLDKNKKSDIKNKSVEDKQRIDANIEDKNENAVFRNKKIEISVKSNEKIENRANKNIENNDKTDDKNKKYDKPRSTAGQACVRDNENDVMLKSYSDSVAESDNEVKRGKDQSERQQRDRALAHMFGFVSGGASKSQRRGTDRRKRTISHSHKRHSQYVYTSSASSEWTSDTGSEFVSSPPRPRGRKGRYTRKYLKPKSAPILSLEEEGGLFVVYNNKIYPLVKDGKNVKNYVNYFPEDDVDPEESYWKLKYVEEKKKTAELTKLLNQAKDNEQQAESSRVPPVQANVENNAIALREDPPLPESTKNVPEILPAKAPEPNPIAEEKKTVKIKFIKNNEEVQLEGHWSQLSPVLAHVAQLFQKEPDPVTPSCASVKTDSLAPEPLVESGKSTPIEEVVEKVNQRENEIAQEIERYHKEEANAPAALPQTQSNVTKRKGRPRKTSPAVPPSPAKIAKLDAEVSEPKEPAEKTQQAAEGQDNTAVTTRRTRTPRNLLAETVEVNQNTIVKTRTATSRKSHEKTIGDTKQTNPDQDDDVRYKFPSPPPTNRKSYTNKSKTNMAAKNTSLRNTKRTTTLFSAENVFLDSIDSMQGYQDSDISPSRLCIKRRRKTSLSFRTHRKRYSIRNRQRTRHPVMTSDSSNSYQSPLLKRMSFQNSTITSEIYRSESYRLLMNKDRTRTKNVSNLGKIVETSPPSKEFDVNMEANKEIAANGNIDLNNKENMSELLQTNTDDNSSSVSLPTSPVLSVVENISISKNCMDLMSSMELGDYPFEDKEEEQITLNKLLTPNDDVTMPLMEQECGIEKSHQDGKAYHYNMSISKTDAAISESLLSKINTVNIQDPSISETLNVKLRNLLLESAKKINMVMDTVNNENTHVDVQGKPGAKKARKRSSTPRKRQSTHKQKLTNTEPCIVEEHTESCSRFGRQSCPPIILISEHDCNETITPTETESAQLLTVKPLVRGRKKKDIIKVKITKPKSKSQDNVNKQKTNFSDSGINETESEIILQSSDDSVELIHNHSDTCLNAHECMEDSIKILDNPGQSIISLDSNTTDSDKIVSQHTVGDMFDKQEMFSGDAQDGSDVVKEYDLVEPRQVNSSDTVYKTPVGTPSSANSVLTEDLSVEIPEQPARNSNWYLFSEEESSNTNCPNLYKNSEAIGLGSRLEQIFPITCAIPDLSTITELSRENGDSKQFSDSNTRTRDVSNSPNIFD